VLYAYIGAFVVGALLLGASLLGAGHEHAASHDVDGGDASAAFALLSVRFWTYLLAFGGVTGLLVRLVAREKEPIPAVAALVVGTAAAAMARTLIRRAAGQGTSGTVRSQDLVGKTGDVVVPFSGGATGKVRVRVAGADVDLLATAADGEPLAKRDEVLIVEMRDEGTAVVTRNPASK
jgi:membrane protein implicated in regulation of membrane protease activity